MILNPTVRIDISFESADGFYNFCELSEQGKQPTLLKMAPLKLCVKYLSAEPGQPPVCWLFSSKLVIDR